MTVAVAARPKKSKERQFWNFVQKNTKVVDKHHAHA
jgi:hypothetical protein